MVAELTLGELLQVVRQRASTTAEGVARAGVGKAPQVGMYLARYTDADLVLVAASADDPGANAVLRHRRHGDHFPLEPYGDWFVGFKLTPSSDAWDSTAPSVRPSLSPITRVGVFSLARRRRAWSSADDQGFWWLGGVFAMSELSPNTVAQAVDITVSVARSIWERATGACYGSQTS